MASSSDSSSKQTNKISLTSAEGKLFEVAEPVAMELGVVKTFFTDNDTDRENVLLPLPNVDSEMLSLVLKYIRAHLEFKQSDPPLLREEVKAFDTAFVEQFNNQKLKEMILAANYLDIKELLEFLTDFAAKRIENKSVKYARDFFEIVNDLRPDEEAKIREEFAWAFEGVEED